LFLITEFSGNLTSIVSVLLSINDKNTKSVLKGRVQVKRLMVSWLFMSFTKTKPNFFLNGRKGELEVTDKIVTLPEEGL